MADPIKVKDCVLQPSSLLLYFERPLASGETHPEVQVLVFDDQTFVTHKLDPSLAQTLPGVNGFFWPFPDALKGEHALVVVSQHGHHSFSKDFDLRSGRFVIESQPQPPLPAPHLPDNARVTQAVEDAVSYALLTESIGGGSSVMPLARTGAPESGGAQLIGQTLRDVLGWKVRDDDPKGFAGALTACFSISDVEGHTEWTYTPRTYAVQSDLNGGITGAQASLYKRAQEALTQSLPLLDGIYPLDPDADQEDIAAVKAVLRRQLQELVGELGAPGGPSITRVNHFFNLLIASPAVTFNVPNTTQLRDPEPDHLAGTLGRLRDLLGLSFADDFVNSIPDEQNQTNYRVLCDYITSLAQSWLNNQRFFGIRSTIPFLGTQLVPVSRQLSVIAESVDEVRYTLDSVFIGAAERQTLELDFGDAGDSMYAEDFFRWIQNFVTDEAPSYVQDGGKFGIGNSVVPFASQLHKMTRRLVAKPGQRGPLPPGFYTARVQRAVLSLAEELKTLVDLTKPLKRDVSAAPAPVKVQAALSSVRIAVKAGMLFFRNKTTSVATLYNLSEMPLYISSMIPVDSTASVHWTDRKQIAPLAGGGTARFRVLATTPPTEPLIITFRASVDKECEGVITELEVPVMPKQTASA